MAYREACFDLKKNEKSRRANGRTQLQVLVVAGFTCFVVACQNSPAKPSPNPTPVKKAVDDKVNSPKPKEDATKKTAKKKKEALAAAKKAEQLKKDKAKKARLEKEKTDFLAAKRKSEEARDAWFAFSKMWKEKGEESVLQRVKLSQEKSEELERSKDFVGALTESNKVSELYQSLSKDLDAKILKKLNLEKDSARVEKEKFEALLKQSSEMPMAESNSEIEASKAYKSAEAIPETEQRNAILAYKKAGEQYRKARTERETAWTNWQKKKAATLASKEQSKVAERAYLKTSKDVASTKSAWLAESKRWGLTADASVEKAGQEQELKAKKLAEEGKFDEANSVSQSVLKTYKDQSKKVFEETNKRVIDARKEAEAARDIWRKLIDKAEKEFLQRPDEATKGELALSEGNELKASRPRKAFQKFKESAGLFRASCESHRVAYGKWSETKKAGKPPVKVEPKTDPKPQPVKEPMVKKEPVKEPKPTPPETKIKPETKPDLSPPPGVNKLKAYTKMDSWEDAKKVLSDRLLWGVSKSVQDKAIAMVTKKLGAAFQFVETKEYKCNGLVHRIATFKHLKSGALLNLLPGGTYQMGSPNGDADENPPHSVTIKALLVGRHELRLAVWNRVATAKVTGEKDLPVSNVSWDQCQTWLKSAGDGLRMLSESEWEYSARAGASSAYYWGDKFDNSHCWNETNTRAKEKGAQSVMAHFKSEKWNSFGLVDVSGNVFEWCQDKWINNYASSPTDGQPLLSGNSPFRVARGGAWLFSSYSCRSAFRGIERPNQAFSMHGLRVAKSLPE